MILLVNVLISDFRMAAAAQGLGVPEDKAAAAGGGGDGGDGQADERGDQQQPGRGDQVLDQQQPGRGDQVGVNSNRQPLMAMRASAIDYFTGAKDLRDKVGHL